MKAPSPPPLLVDAINGNHAIAFVGSGISVPSGAPSWRELLYELLATAEDLPLQSKNPLLVAMQHIERNDYIEAASIIANLFQPHALSGAIVQAMTYSRKPIPMPGRTLKGSPHGRLIKTTDRPIPRDLRPTKSQELLLRLNLQAIITTNYDRLLEAAWGSDKIASFSRT